MSDPALLCPQCHTPITAVERVCPGCGLDLTMMMLLLEQQAISDAPGQMPPYIVDTLVPKLGQFLLSKGLITEEKLRDALAHQRKKNEDGLNMMLGETLIELGLISRENLDRIIMIQVMELQAALQIANQELEKRVTERTADLERAVSKLNESNQLKSNFVSNISHELRTPLSQIKGYVSLLYEGALGELTPEQADAAQSTVVAIQRLEKLIEDLIRMASAARGELVLDTCVFCITDMAHSIVTRHMSKAHRANLQLESQIPPDPVFTEGDMEKLNWVISQLVDNAIKFTPSEGRVILSIEVDLQRARTFVTVRDTGIGIPFDRLPELFQTFHQLDGSATRRYGGTGLGLALIYRILDAHHTQIKVESAPGQGTVFSFELPLSQVN